MMVFDPWNLPSVEKDEHGEVKVLVFTHFGETAHIFV
jgi:predicted RNA-binding protein with PIN domain